MATFLFPQWRVVKVAMACPSNPKKEKVMTKVICFLSPEKRGEGDHGNLLKNRSSLLVLRLKGV